MKALVTGGAGFIGSHLCEHLLAEGSEAAVIDDLSTCRSSNIEGIMDETLEIIIDHFRGKNR